MMFGNQGPMSDWELVYWRAFFVYKSKLDQEANDPKKNKKSGQQLPKEFKRTLGPSQT